MVHVCCPHSYSFNIISLCCKFCSINPAPGCKILNKLVVLERSTSRTATSQSTGRAAVRGNELNSASRTGGPNVSTVAAGAGGYSAPVSSGSGRQRASSGDYIQTVPVHSSGGSGGGGHRASSAWPHATVPQRTTPTVSGVKPASHHEPSRHLYVPSMSTSTNNMHFY